MIVDLQFGSDDRGRTSRRRIDADTRARVIELATSDRYRGANDSHLTELLSEREGISLSRPSVQRILRAAGLDRSSGEA